MSPTPKSILPFLTAIQYLAELRIHFENDKINGRDHALRRKPAASRQPPPAPTPLPLSYHLKICDRRTKTNTVNEVSISRKASHSPGGKEEKQVPAPIYTVLKMFLDLLTCVPCSKRTVAQQPTQRSSHPFPVNANQAYIHEHILLNERLLSRPIFINRKRTCFYFLNRF